MTDETTVSTEEVAARARELAVERELLKEAARRRAWAERHAAIYCAACGHHIPTLAGITRHWEEARTGPLAALHTDEDDPA